MAYPMSVKTVKSPSSGSGTGGLALSAGSKNKPKDRGSWVRGLVTLIIVLIIIGGGIYLIVNYTGTGSGFGLFPSRLQNDWQAVFLSNGQVYFGKVVKMEKESLILQNIYYLQVVTQPLQQSAEGEVAQQPEQRLTLIKLGNEIHGPKDEMIINRDHVILIEDLRADGRVVQAINDYINNQQAGQ